ncbi:hypothetical protein V1505DRAFT_362265 [Lipomyces doorenjongii]
MKLIASWSKHQMPARLGDLVDGVYRLWQVGDLRALLDTIPNRDMDPTLRQSLLNIISKVARYRETARVLYGTAKKFPLARQMKVVLVDLPQEAFYRVPANEYSPVLATNVVATQSEARENGEPQPHLSSPKH